MSDFGEYTELLQAAIEASLAARDAILEVYGSDDFQVEKKADESPLTRADRSSHAVITNLLRERFVDIPILSEEGGDIPFEERSQWNRYWLVDPLDGTKEFVKRNGEFTINIALIENNVPTLGVVCIPVSGTTYYAVKGHGAFIVNDITDVSSMMDVKYAKQLPTVNEPFENRAIRVVASRSHFNEESRAFVEGLEKANGEVKLVNVGSALKLCVVAEGKADVYPRYAPTMEWDTGAGHIVAEEGGCVVQQVDTGEPLQYNKKNLRNPWFVVMRESFTPVYSNAVE